MPASVRTSIASLLLFDTCHGHKLGIEQRDMYHSMSTNASQSQSHLVGTAVE